MLCKHCNSNQVKKTGSYKVREQRVQRYHCKTCFKTFTSRTFSKNYRMRKHRYAPMICNLYCEGMSQRAIARVLKINVKTVEKYFIRESHIASEARLKSIDCGDIKTSFIQVDEMQTFEHSHKRPLGIQIAVRASTSEIIGAYVCRIPMVSVTATRAQKDAYAKQSTRLQKKIELALDLEKVFKAEKNLRSDYNYFRKETILKLIPDIKYEAIPQRQGPLWKLDKVLLMMRQNISRLRRSTLSTTKRIDRLQNHLDLYIQYHNKLKNIRK